MDALLSLRGVSKQYWRGARCVAVLEDVSLDVHAGELVAVWGRHNSGKTTLLKLAAGLEQPSAGIVAFAGRDLAGLSAAGLARLRRKPIAWARPTGPESGDLKMLDYVAMPLLRRERHKQARRGAAAALERVGVAGCAMEVWRNLSDSERTLVAVAHAIVREPELLLIDDQTANLDYVQREDLMVLLREAAEAGMAMLVTVPDMAEMVHAHTIRSLSGGRLLAPAARAGAEGNVIDFPVGGDRRAEGAGGAPA
ncbi:MAG TPA: ATP-binding cassette domain-containing protein [Solirubrobacteraceae bacterium]|jgi:putative ABC transport system ATP-binding protein|nr:ATP-binding cassette domain-containing protein [Solirubrobacteraceae bacterium]